jgi:hypothetical protein
MRLNQEAAIRQLSVPVSVPVGEIRSTKSEAPKESAEDVARISLTLTLATDTA